MPRTPWSEMVIVPSHDAKRPTMLAPVKWRFSLFCIRNHSSKLQYIYRVELAKLATNAPSLVQEIDLMLSRVKWLASRWTAISPNTALEMPHHDDPVRVENVPRSRKSDLDKGTESRHETLNILTAKRNMNFRLDLWGRCMIAEQCNAVHSSKRRQTVTAKTLHKIWMGIAWTQRMVQ